MTQDGQAETDIPPPRLGSELVGQVAAEQLLLDSALGGRLHHGWMLHGSSGIGKATLAYRFARFLLAGGADSQESGLFGTPEPPKDLHVDPDSQAARLIAAQAHPDFHVIDRGDNSDSKSIPVDKVRALGSFFAHMPAMGGWRVALIDGADALNRHGQNALLKILEEPPARSILLMTVSQPGLMLATIRSRTQKLALQNLSEDDVASLLLRLMPDLGPDDAHALSVLADGSIGRALTLAQQDALNSYRGLIDLLGDYPDIDFSRVHKLGDQFTKTRDETEYRLVADLLMRLLGRLCRSAAGAGQGRAVLPDEEALIERMAAHGRLDRWVAVWDKTRTLFSDAERSSLDRKQTLVTALAQL